MGSKTTVITGQIECIELLRIIAAIGIAIYHVDYIYATGLRTDFGMDLFFMISSFLMMYTTQKKRKSSAFFINRMIRLLPLYWILTIFTFAVSKFIPAFSSISGNATVIEFIKSMIFIPYTRSAQKSVGIVMRPIVGPGWTLYYEVYFSFLFAFVMKFWHKRRGIIIFVITVVLGMFGRVYSSDIVFFNFITRYYCLDFAVGIVYFEIYKKMIVSKTQINLKIRTLSTICALIGCVLACVFKAVDPIFFVLFSSIVLAASLVAGEGVKLPEWIVKLGGITYSFYLIHYYVLTIVDRIIPLSKINVLTVLATIGFLCITGGLAIISKWLIEDKLGTYIKYYLIHL